MIKQHLCLALLVSAACNAFAADGQYDFPKIEVSGYGTIGAARTDKEDSLYRSSTIQESGAKKDWDFGVDSVMAVQLHAKASPVLSFMAQGVSRNGVGGSYNPEILWATANIDPLPGLSIRVGRTILPLFSHSDTLYLNHVREWIRPPPEVYTLAPYKNLDGIDAVYRFSAGSYLVEAQSFFGVSRLPIPNGSADLNGVHGIRIGVAQDAFSALVSYARAQVTVAAYGGIFDRIYAGAERAHLPNVKEQVQGSDGVATYKSASFKYETPSFTVTGEYARREVTAYYGSAHAWYLGVSKKIGAFTPYAYTARQKSDSRAIPNLTAYPSINAALEFVNAARNNAQRSNVIGIRYDLSDKVAFKLQGERILPDKGAWGVFRPADFSLSMISRERPVHVVGFSFDFYF